MDSWVEEVVTYLEENLRQLLFCGLVMVYATNFDKKKAIGVHWDNSNELTQTHLPPILPFVMVKLCPAKLFRKVCDQCNRLDHSFPLPSHIEILGDQQK